MFIKSFRLKNLLAVSGAVLIGLALGIGVLLLAARSAGEDPRPSEIPPSI